MAILFRALVYATAFVGFVLVFLPARVLAWAGVTRPAAIGPAQVAGLIVGAAGAALALWCVLTFALTGLGTPAPFDPPRRLVVSGPYRFVRNPMYLGAALAVSGAALFYRSLALLGFVGLFGLAAQGFVLSYEEPALKQRFGPAYEEYRRRVGRWWPRRVRTRP